MLYRKWLSQGYGLSSTILKRGLSTQANALADFNPLMVKLSESMAINAYPKATVKHTDTVLDAIKVMASNNVGNVLIYGDNGRVAGIFTERDYIRKISLKNRTSSNTVISEVMTPKPIAVSTNYTLEQCIATMMTARCRRLPVIGEDGVIGVVTIRYILEQLHKQLCDAKIDLSRSVYGKSVLTVISDKGITAKEDNVPKFATISPYAMVYDALEEMEKTGTGALIVSEFNDGQIDGIITERDHLTKLIIEGKRSRATPIYEIMTKAPLHEVGPETTIGQALELMVEEHIRHCPVVMHLADSFSQEYRAMGVISMKDIVGAIYKSKALYV